MLLASLLAHMPPNVKKVGYYLVSLAKLLPRHERWRKQAELLKLSRGARSRLEWFIWHENHGENASKTARHFGIAGKTFWKWQKRFDQKNLRMLEEKSRSPQHVRQKEITPEEESRLDEICDRIQNRFNEIDTDPEKSADWFMFLAAE